MYTTDLKGIDTSKYLPISVGSLIRRPSRAIDVKALSVKGFESGILLVDSEVEFLS